jgi:hypothetical protein
MVIRVDLKNGTSSGKSRSIFVYRKGKLIADNWRHTRVVVKSIVCEVRLHL